jgi:hypothetical protein
MKHTPGPWKSMPCGTRFAVVSESSLLAGDVCRCNREPNANLIAASPDLLLVAKKILATVRCDWSQMTPEEKNWADDYANDDGTVETMLREVIRKAEGQ